MLTLSTLRADMCVKTTFACVETIRASILALSVLDACVFTKALSTSMLAPMAFSASMCVWQLSSLCKLLNMCELGAIMLFSAQ